MALSTFDLFKIGIGPSSSHTVGPMLAAARFVDAVAGTQIGRIRCELYGSLAATGRGHATDTAVMLGLAGHRPDSVDIDRIPDYLRDIREHGRIVPRAASGFAFRADRDLVFRSGESLPFHANGMRFTALGSGGERIRSEDFYSVGGGFIVTGASALANVRDDAAGSVALPHPFASADALLALTDRLGCSIADVVRHNEACWRSDAETDSGLLHIWRAMHGCIARGCRTEGLLPGPFGVRRRAPALASRLGWQAGPMTPYVLDTDPLRAMDVVNLFALAVNEENAAGGRIVTAPTNGAAGIVPAVLQYYVSFIGGADERGIADFLLTAAAIGMLFKTNASISGAEVGCQGEVRVACAMAAAGLCAVLGGTPAQVENAAEIGMEHHLGLTCDPVGGLVQIPCIERNAVAAVKAINAARLALHGDGSHHVSLDTVIKTMRETGADMSGKYKETSRGGLAVNIVAC